jgi:hypothetical protein
MNGNRFRNRASFGKRQEYIVIAEMLKRGFDVYIPLVDDQQIDCIIRRGENDYLDVQIKARSKDCVLFDAGRFAAMDIPNPRENYFFIFYSEQANCYWVFPSLHLVELASRNKKGSNVGKYHINLTGHSKKKGLVYPNPKFDDYKNNFELLAGERKEEK